MNTEKSQTPGKAPKKSSSYRTLFNFILALLAVVVWAAVCRSCIRANPGMRRQITLGNGAALFGKGSGSGDSGTGYGAGDSGNSVGKYQSPAASGIGKTGSPPGGGINSDNGISSGNSGIKQGFHEADDENIRSIARHTPQEQYSDSASGGTVSGRKGFYGIAVKRNSKAIFIVDISGSMGSSSREFSGKTRLDVLKMELKKAVFGSENYTSSTNRIGGFVILPFSDRTGRFPDEKICRYRNQEQMKQSEIFIDNLTPGGGTLMKGAFQQAINIAASENIDTIYFMTDGESSDNITAEWLFNELKKAPRNLQLHCVALGRNQDFMRQVSQKYNGRYIYLP